MNVFKKIIAKLTGASFEALTKRGPEQQKRDVMTELRTSHPERPPSAEQKFRAESEEESRLAEERRRSAEQHRAEGSKERFQ